MKTFSQIYKEQELKRRLKEKGWIIAKDGRFGKRIVKDER